LWYNGGMTADNWINLIAAILIGGGTLALALMTWKSIRQTRNIREEDRELDSKKRRLEEVQHWINEVVTIKSECASPVGSPPIWRERESKARIIVANKEYIRTEAEKLDSEFTTETKLVDNIKRLSFLLETHKGQSLSAPEHQQEIEDLCTESLIKISTIKARLKL
jgi:hypothetical protein